MLRLLRYRFLPPLQEASCAFCGLVLVERHRRPCPRCGSLNRNLVRTATETLGALDKPN